jgi:hypothetical protein
MENQIILYENQQIDSFTYSSEVFTNKEKSDFISNSILDWNKFSNAKIVCNFAGNLTSSYLADINDKITGYQILKKRPEENVAKSLGIFSSEELEKNKNNDIFYHLIDYNVKSNNEYTYFISPLTNEYAQTTLQGKVLASWDVFLLSPIYKIQDNKYGIIKNKFGEPINWVFQLNCSEGNITLNQDKTIFTTFASKPKISIGSLNYYTGNFSCLLGNCLYNDQYYEPNILLELWDEMIKENNIYLFKNPKGDAMIISLEDGTKRKYMNEVANYVVGSYNGNIAITNRPTTIDFSYLEIADADNIIICGD